MPTDGRQKLHRTPPQAQGVPSSSILAFVEAAEQKFGGLHSFMLLRHGAVIGEGWWSPYGKSHPHMLFSLSKSFTSTGVGLAVAEGRLSVDDFVLSFFPDDAPPQPGENLKAMRVRHLLSMSTGNDKDTLGPLFEREDGNWVKGFLAQPVEHAPGTKFVYNSGATYMLSAIVQKRTGKTLLQYLTPRLFEPLGIKGATWETCPRGINTGGWGLSVKTEDIARFGQLYLQRGKWGDRQVVPEAWVKEATTTHVSNGSKPDSDWEQGYGYQFWRSRHGAYRGDGAFGQYCVVMPEQDMVLAVTSGVGDMQAVLNLVWEHLLPAAKREVAPNRDAAERLEDRLERLSLRPQEGMPTTPLAETASGRVYRFEPNDQKVESVKLAFGAGKCVLTLKDGLGEHRIEAGSGAWKTGTTSFDGGRSALSNGGRRKVSASGAWTGADTYEMKLAFYETPFRPTLAFRFENDQMRYQYKANVAFGPTEHPPLTGKTEA